MNLITREDLANLICESTQWEMLIVDASGSGTDFDFLTFETYPDENEEYHWLDIWNEERAYIVSYQYKRFVEVEVGELVEDEEFGYETYRQVICKSVEEIIEFMQSQF